MEKMVSLPELTPLESDEILMADPEDEDAIELKYETTKNAVLHTFRLMEECNFDKTEFGKIFLHCKNNYVIVSCTITVRGGRRKRWIFL